VIGGLAAFLGDGRAIAEAVARFELDLRDQHRIIKRWAETAVVLESLAVAEQRSLLMQLGVRVTVCGDRVEASFDPARLAQDKALPSACGEGEDKRAIIPLQGVLVRRGQEMRLVYPVDGPHRAARRDPRLVSLLVKGHTARAELLGQQGHETDAIGQIRKSHLCRVARASYLAPDIVQAILDGRQPSNLTGRQILKAGDIPLDWDAQRRLFNFPPSQ
jgi:hypothetical protein